MDELESEDSTKKLNTDRSKNAFDNSSYSIVVFFINNIGDNNNNNSIVWLCGIKFNKQVNLNIVKKILTTISDNNSSFLSITKVTRRIYVVESKREEVELSSLISYLVNNQLVNTIISSTMNTIGIFLSSCSHVYNTSSLRILLASEIAEIMKSVEIDTSNPINNVTKYLEILKNKCIISDTVTMNSNESKISIPVSFSFSFSYL